MTVRPWLAVALVITATAGPVIAWYFAAAEETDREAGRVVGGMRAAEVETAARLAARASDRLEALREAESRRPWFHYQPFFHDPRSVSEGLALTPSPLAEGPADPFVRAQFQLDEANGLSVFGMAGLSIELAALVERIRQAAPTCDPGTTARVDRLEASAFFQNARAGELVAQASRQSATLPPPGGPAVDVRTTPLEWRTLRGGLEPLLVAVRCVGTPAGSRVQGLVVDTHAVEQWMREGSPARLVPSPPSIPTGRLSLHGAAWSVRMADARKLADAMARADEIRRDFRRSFALRATLSGLLALAAVTIVLQDQSLARRRADFAAAAAHELRTPLASIRLHAEMLAEGLADPAKAGPHARIVAQEAERLGRVVANILASTRLERAGPRVAPAPGDLASAVGDIIERQRAVLESSGMTVAFSAEESLPKASFDGDAIAEILVNLLDNAERHSRGAAERRIAVSVRRERPGRQAIVVADTGPGIPAARRRDLFRAFTRPEGSTGLGLGLVIARALARAQGGDVSIEESGAAGTRIRVTVPEAGGG